MLGAQAVPLLEGRGDEDKPHGIVEGEEWEDPIMTTEVRAEGASVRRLGGVPILF